MILFWFFILLLMIITAFAYEAMIHMPDMDQVELERSAMEIIRYRESVRDHVSGTDWVQMINDDEVDPENFGLPDWLPAAAPEGMWVGAIHVPAHDQVYVLMAFPPPPNASAKRLAGHVLQRHSDPYWLAIEGGSSGHFEWEWVIPYDSPDDGQLREDRMQRFYDTAEFSVDLDSFDEKVLVQDVIHLD